MPLITLKALVVPQKLYPSLPKRSTIRQISLRSRVIAQKIPFLRNEIPFFPNVSIRSEINKIEVINHVNMPLITLEALVSSRRWCCRRIPSQLCKLFRNKIPGFPGANPWLSRSRSQASQEKIPGFPEKKTPLKKKQFLKSRSAIRISDKLIKFQKKFNKNR